MAMARTFCLSSPFQIPPSLLSKPNSQSLPLRLRSPTPILQIPSSPARIQCIRRRSLSPPFQFSGRIPRVPTRATKVGGTAEGEEKRGNADDKDDAEFRGVGTTPERFKFNGEPEPVTIPRPPLWTLLLALACFIYTWRIVLWELGNWKNSLFAILRFLGDSLQFILGTVNDFLGDPISFAVYTIRSVYSSIISAAPVPELTTIVMLASVIMAVAETASPDSIKSQPYLLTASGIIGYSAVSGYISERYFWTMLFGLFCVARFIKKRDYVSSALPVATVLASVGEPWVRVLTIISFTGLAVYHHWKKSAAEVKKGNDTSAASERRLPLPLVAVALAIGMRVAAQWAGYRHLTWKIV